MDNFRNAAKAFVVRRGKLLMLRRRENDPHKAGAWDIPGGRLELGEDPFEGLKRETQEEIQCDVDIVMPIWVHHFTRDDGQKITLTIFWCILLTDDIVLSSEHSEYRWMDLEKDLNQIPDFFAPAIKNYQDYIRHD